MIRRFEYIGKNPNNKSGRSQKFWEIEYENGKLTRRWGRIGTRGRTKVEYDQRDYQVSKLVRSKLAKGYREVSRTQNVPASPVVVDNRRSSLERVAPLMNKVPVDEFLTIAESALNDLYDLTASAEYYDRSEAILRRYVRDWLVHEGSAHESVCNGVRWFYAHLGAAVFGSLLELEERGLLFDQAAEKGAAAA